MPSYGLASGDDQFNPKVLPRRLMEDEIAERFNRPSSAEFQAAFDKAAAQWLSRDCHRSQYGYPFRVGIELALENRHRSVTFASFTCSGADVAAGLFLDMDAARGLQRAGRRQGARAARPAERPDLPRRRAGASQQASYTLPMYSVGSTSISTQTVTKIWCPPQARKRPIDVVLMSIGGNDVGFGALAAYAMTESAGDLAPIAGLVGARVRFGPQVSRVYLDVLDERMKAVKDALHDGFGVPPARVLQIVLRADPVRRERRAVRRAADARHRRASEPEAQQAAAAGDRRLPARLPRPARMHRRQQARPDCPADLATGAGTGFTLVTDHIPEFTKRGMCARDPKRALADGDQHARAAPSPRTATTSSPIRRRRRCPMPTTGGCSARQRRVPRRQYASRRHLAVRHPAAGLCGPLQRRDPSDRGRRTPSSPTTWSATCARSSTSATWWRTCHADLAIYAKTQTGEAPRKRGFTFNPGTVIRSHQRSRHVELMLRSA